MRRCDPTMNMPDTKAKPVQHCRAARYRAMAVAAFAAALLAACTPMRWERNGLALDYTDQDWNNCRSQSVASANRWMFDPFPFPYGFNGRDARGRPFYYYRPSPYPNRFMLEQEYLDNCLRARGFRRVPVQPERATTPDAAPKE